MEYTEILKINKNEFKNRKFKIEIRLIEIFENNKYLDNFIIYKKSKKGNVSELFNILINLKNNVNNFIHKFIGVYKNE